MFLCNVCFYVMNVFHLLNVLMVTFSSGELPSVILGTPEPVVCTEPVFGVFGGEDNSEFGEGEGEGEIGGEGENI